MILPKSKLARREALKKESDSASKERLSRLEAEIGKMNDEILEMKAHWQNEKDLIQTIQKIKEEQEQLGIESQQAEREGDLARVAELRYGRALELENRLNEANQNLAKLQEHRKMLKEEVDAEDWFTGTQSLADKKRQSG